MTAPAPPRPARPPPRRLHRHGARPTALRRPDSAETEPATAQAESEPEPVPPRLVGTFVDQSGRPLPGVRLTFWGGLATRWRVGAAETDPLGRYVFAELPGGATLHHDDGTSSSYLGITFEHPTHASADGLSWWDVTVPNAPGSVVSQDFLLVPGGELSGVLRHARTGEPLALDLRLYQGEHKGSTTFFRYVSTDEHGRFHETALYPGRYLMDVNSVKGDYPIVGTLDVAQGERRDVELTLDWNP